MYMYDVVSGAQEKLSVIIQLFFSILVASNCPLCYETVALD